MSKLYDILKEIERKPADKSPSGGASTGGRNRLPGRPLWLAGLIFLFFLASGGSFWVFERTILHRTQPPRRVSSGMRPPPGVGTPTKTEAVTKVSPGEKKSTAPSGLPERVVLLRTEKSEPKGGRASPPRKSSPRPETRAEVRKNPAAPPPLAPEERLRGLLVRAEALRAEGRCEEALPLYQEYLRARRDPGVLNNYGACLWLEGRLSEADRVFRQALKLKNDPLIRLNLVLLALERGDLENACRQFRFLTGNLSDPSARSLYEAARIRLKGRCVRNR